MPNLIESFGGLVRFYDKFDGSMFKDADGDSLLVSRARHDYPEQDKVACRKIKLTASGRVSSQVETKTVPASFFSDMGVFGLPELGWRATAAGKMLVYHQKSDTTYHRGTCVRVLSSTVSGFSRWLASAGDITIPTETTEIKVAHSILNPTFHTMAEGLALIREGRLASFAINHKLAVTPNPEGNFDLWYKLAVAGTITESGEVRTTNTYAQSTLMEEAA